MQRIYSKDAEDGQEENKVCVEVQLNYSAYYEKTYIPILYTYVRE